MDNQKQIAGRMGGQQTLERYGRDHFVEIGQMGGRPRAKVLGSLPASITKGGMLPGDLSELRGLWRSK